MSTYIPSDVVDMSKEKDWAASLGLMDWDSTSIVFTKRTLLEFLKYTGTTVDTNYSNIQKLPRYAKFGKIAEAETSAASESTDSSIPVTAAALTDESANATDRFKPTRRVRAPPGGETHDLFGHYVDDDALANAPTSNNQAEESTKSRTLSGASETFSPFEESNPVQRNFKPSRRVREMPGGKDSLAGIL